jgi:hypothetical protein
MEVDCTEPSPAREGYRVSVAIVYGSFTQFCKSAVRIVKLSMAVTYNAV